ncbi:hypothetical protein QBC47DRAFT_358242 [Echria macrotheca]|uniref:PH domain-containing protein n=1 Tax=Echria macrotheca TaxID=438768 RepID=A0AAJ0F8U9_9PEZI|nr:hypothetical protein QBC47DRAFT_358242 [Echria macrotheca]
MATSIASDKPVAASGSDGFDPFVTSPLGPSHLRHSNFDTQLFALNPGTPAEQVRRAIEAHLKDTERRMEEAGKLGTALVQQRKELTERLREVEQLQSESELNPELRQRLAEIEKDYNDVARETARAFLPKQRIPSNEAAQGSPFAPEGKGGRRSVSPSKFESMATGSPTKLNVPNRKLRNQPANRIHDIEFAAEISTSLISQVRNLQALLSEREEELKDIKVERSRLELEAEGYQQRMKTLDESENRYKDENWNLETQMRELMASLKDSADREKKLSQSLSVLQAEKTATQRELEEVKDNLAKQDEKHAAAIKNLEIELGTSRRNAANSETERLAMQRKVEELTSQNQELAKAFSIQRGRALERESGRGLSEDDFKSASDNATPEHSPPPSPIKGTPRHSMLESETLKTSLGHAQRTIQTLRTNIHREKTEKLELKRMLQDARDELEKMRNDPNVGNKRSRKVDSREFKKPRLFQLGVARSSRTELYVEDPDWEDQADNQSPASFSPANSTLRLTGTIPPIVESSSDHFETANETSDAAFETAHERGTETEDFQTGAEELSDEDEATETEASPSKGSSRIKRPPVLNPSGGRYSFDSTASTSDDNDDYGMHNLKTPTSHSNQRMRLQSSRGTLARRSRQLSEEPTLQSSPASFAVSSTSNTPQQGGQSLFAELGEFENGSDDDSYVGDATPSRRSVRSMTPGSVARGRASPPPEVPPLPKLIMVDSGVMTDPVEFGPAVTAVEKDEDRVASPDSVIFHERPMSMESVIGPSRSHASTQWLGDEARFSRPLSSFSYSDASVQNDTDFEAKLAQFPSPPTSSPNTGLGVRPILLPPESLSMSFIKSEDIEPVEPPSSPPSLGMSSILTEDTEPIAEPEAPVVEPPVFRMSSVVSEHIEPRLEPAPEPVIFSMSPLVMEHVTPVAEPEPPALSLSIPVIITEDIEPVTEPVSPVALSVSTIRAEEVEPIELPPSPVSEPKVVVVPEIRLPPPLSFSSIVSETVEPQSEPVVSPARLSFVPLATEEVEPRQEALPEFTVSTIAAQHVEPQERPSSPLPEFSLSTIESQEIEPVVPEIPVVVAPALSVAAIKTLESHPIEATPDELDVHTPPLSFAAIQALDSEPISPRSPKRNGFIIPRDVDYLEQDTPHTPPNVARGLDDGAPSSKTALVTADQAAQTALTAAALDEILKAKNQPFEAAGLVRSNSNGSVGTPSTVRVHRPRQPSADSTRRIKGKTTEVGGDAPDAWRPASSGSNRGLQRDLPPLPANHKEVIEAARTGSSGGGQGTVGTMGPPLFPASALKNQQPVSRPRTPNGGRRPMSPVSQTSGRGTPTPRPPRMGSSVQGSSQVHSPTRLTQHSRKSSVSSFVSEIDSRFNMQQEGPFDSHGFGPNTDPRMIQAITQTMIGEYLWKYTRKAGRGEISENRHRRYFWVHPYTRTLYWSDRDPSSAGRAELRAKSVQIEAVRVVTDDNPMPPGLHRKSLVIISPGRTIKFTCTTGQRHETWFNALSYLLLRTNNEGQSDAEEMAGNITREDVDEFNPSYGRRMPTGTRAAASLSSYNSRTIRNESPAIDVSMNFPTLTPKRSSHTQERPAAGTLSRISGYWKDSKMLSGTFGSLRSRSVSGRDPNSSIYEVDEVQDSAEDLRQMIERQDREADRLENVRACCDGKHDVGTLTGASKRGRHARGHLHVPGHSHSHSQSGPSVASTPAGTTRSRA